MYNIQEYTPTHISTSGTTVVFQGQGRLHTVTVNTSTATALSLYDGVTGGTLTPVAVLKSSIAEGTYVYHIAIVKGLIIQGGGGDYTIATSKI